jgi:hypothetical protein
MGCNILSATIFWTVTRDVNVTNGAQMLRLYYKQFSFRPGRLDDFLKRHHLFLQHFTYISTNIGSLINNTKRAKAPRKHLLIKFFSACLSLLKFRPGWKTWDK